MMCSPSSTASAGRGSRRSPRAPNRCSSRRRWTRTCHPSWPEPGSWWRTARSPVPEPRSPRSTRPLRVTAVTEVTHRSGDKPVDSVDKPRNALSRRVTKRPDEGLDIPLTGNHPGGASDSGTESDVSTGPNGQPSGRDLAHAALEAAKAKAKERGAPPNLRRGRITGGGGQNPRRRRWSGAGADARDPQPLGRLVSRLVADSGWQDTMTNARVF